MKSKILLSFFALVGFCFAETGSPLLLRMPSVSSTQIVFNYGGNLWIVGRDGGDARRLTAGLGGETEPLFSPDGSMIAFTGDYSGNADVYVVPSSGGQPRRLTFHPGADHVVGWTPDGKRIVFTSARNSYHHFDRLFTVPVEGGFPAELPLPIAESASFSKDGTHIAYVPHPKWQRAWKRYRGGQTTPIWIADLRDSKIEKVPRDNSNDFNPMWVDNKIYFLSDRNGGVSLFAYDLGSKQVSEVLKNDNGFDFKSASAGPDSIVIEQFGKLLLLDLKTQQAKPVNVGVAGDIEQLRPRYVKVEQNRIKSFNLSPTGTRVLMEAWGEIFSIPSDKGDIRNLTHSPAVADRDPAWSPDGRWVAYFSDEPGEYELQLRDQTGLGKVRHINLGNPPSFFYTPVFSPDSKKIVYSDKRMNLWYVDIDKGAPKLVDTDYYEGPSFSQNWAPDSKWIAYAKQLPSHLHAIYVYSLEQGKSYQITDGMSDALNPVFDKNGKYLYFTASTDTGLTAGQGWDMSGDERPVTRSAYVAVLANNVPSPLAPESDEEKVKAEIKEQKEQQTKDKNKPDGKDSATAADSDKNKDADNDKDKDKKDDDKPVVVRVDIQDIGQRILALPVPAKNYLNLVAGKSGILFLSEGPDVI
ncbi:MAG TPA: protease, partial [Terriglobales bacterium]